MKNLITLFIISTALLISCNYSRKDDNKMSSEEIDKYLEDMKNSEGTLKITLKHPKCEIIFPVTKVEDDSTIQIINEKEVTVYNMTANTSKSKDDNLGYQVNYVYCPDVKTESEIEKLYNDQREYIISSLNAKIEFEKITELNGTKGRHLYLTIDNSNIKANYRMYFKDGVFFYLTVLTNEDHLFNKSINKFFGSFKI